ncbi:MAG: DUF86 domain-containing protein [Ruminiclostridium sp.]|nr:DUF86 domain-containing protein [Ruminiclostridium sp.]
MTDNIIICKKLSVLLEYYKELKKVVKDISLENYSGQLLIKRTVEREIQLIVECATNINNMILKKLNKGPSKDYFNSFIDLAEDHVLELEFALKIAPSTGLRNILVHEYQKIDDEIVFRSIENVTKYYLEYIDIISRYLGCR